MLRQILNPIIIFISFFIILFIYTKVAGPLPFSVNSVTTNKTDLFTVTGEGTVAIKPDIAIVNIGITANAPTVQAAQDQINKVINQISSAVKQLGIDEKDIKTTNYSINPSYDFTSGSQRITGFNANTSLTIKIRNIDKVNDIIDAATANGANQVGNVVFDIDDKAKAEDQARQQAVDNAKKKANDAARIAGFQLGRLVNYSEDLGSTPRPIAYDLKVAPAIGGQAENTQIETGSSEIRIIVNLSYEIR